MNGYTSSYAQNHFGVVMEECLEAPVHITMDGRPYAVILSLTEYKRLKWIEENFFGQLASIAESCGFMDEEEMNRWVTEKLDVSFKLENQ
jgi:prevent-host-death family protein